MFVCRDDDRAVRFRLESGSSPRDLINQTLGDWLRRSQTVSGLKASERAPGEVSAPNSSSDLGDKRRIHSLH